jgi:hypothetical protein
MADQDESLRDWHRLFGLLLTDFFSGSPFQVEVEPDLSQQQQFLDVVIVRRRRGRFAGRLPDGLAGLAEHNLITFKSHHETLNAWAMKELASHSVSYRKLVSPSPKELLPEELFRLYAVTARLPHNLSQQVPWQQQQAGVYHCQWATDRVTVIVTGELPREAHNAPLHLFSAAPELVAFARDTYRRRSPWTSGVLGQLLEKFQKEGFAMSYTVADFIRDYIKEHFGQLTPEEQQEVLRALPPEKQQEVFRTLPPELRLAGLSAEQIREYLEKLTAHHPTQPPRPRSKKRSTDSTRP